MKTNRRGFIGAVAALLSPKPKFASGGIVEAPKAAVLVGENVNTLAHLQDPLRYSYLASISWTEFVNDDLKIFGDLAKKAAAEHRRKEELFGRSLFRDAS